ncbi:MAG: UDP-N-acetylmuramate dehydrogenase [Xanthomonadales bacterium]|nr:UDP-N-acetylmuramate dehydrogenase [Xanthomonadales bacterium]ODU93545.1 MAG: UDP-N-acetylenolpyruvoylglucosamine reductase [Rhodanobacter sp. SCN 66-43]OJY86642.1 MAG: UDP-N-acetylenolpyruvoylglucosamine reductase [Xanthomonadales bacterium 66-474]
MSNEGMATTGYTLTENASLRERNTLRVDAHAGWLAEVHDAAAIPVLLDHPALRDTPPLLLGEGSNVLFAGDYDGAIVSMRTRGIEVLAEDADAVRIRVAAGEHWDDFVRWTLAHGHAGLENLILIPGSVGAAPMQNIGAYGVEVGEFIETVEAFDLEQRSFRDFANRECEFGYRDSIFKRHPDRWLIATVALRLPRDWTPRIDYAGLREELARMGIDRPAPIHVADAVVNLRTRKLPDPKLIGNAGSFFKNPLVPAAQADALRREHPQLPSWPAGEGTSKLSAAWLIEACGFKGLREGDAGISNRHALVLVNHGNASGAQLWALAQRVREGVEARFGITLEPEPRIIGAVT